MNMIQFRNNSFFIEFQFKFSIHIFCVCVYNYILNFCINNFLEYLFLIKNVTTVLISLN